MFGIAVIQAGWLNSVNSLFTRREPEEELKRRVEIVDVPGEGGSRQVGSSVSQPPEPENQTCMPGGAARVVASVAKVARVARRKRREEVMVGRGLGSTTP